MHIPGMGELQNKGGKQMSGGFYTRAEIREAIDKQVGQRLPGRPEQSPFELSDLQNYIIGSKRKWADWTLRYSKSVEALACLARLLINTNIAPGATGHVNEDGFEGNLKTAAAIGDRYVDVADTASRDKDYYQGGYFVAYGATVFHQHHIVSSDAGDGSKVRLYLLEPIASEAIALTDGVTAYLNKYSDVGLAGHGGGAGFETFIGLNLIPVTGARKFFWLVTAGPCIVTPTGAPNYPGDAANLRMVTVNPADGTIQNAKDADPSQGYQVIGSLISSTVNTYGDLLIDLKLDE
jgi:hypothetical protein